MKKINDEKKMLIYLKKKQEEYKYEYTIKKDNKGEYFNIKLGVDKYKLYPDLKNDEHHKSHILLHKNLTSEGYHHQRTSGNITLLIKEIYEHQFKDYRFIYEEKPRKTGKTRRNSKKSYLNKKY